MKKIIVIGGGFAGISFLKKLGRNKELDITLIEKEDSSSFLPMLPDVIGRGISAKNLAYPLKALQERLKFTLLKEEVTSLGPDRKEVYAAGQKFNYDYLVIASGSETNFYGNDKIKSSSYKLDNAEDAQNLGKAIEAGNFENFVVAGGGYTGIEVATNLRVNLNRKRRQGKVIIVERAPYILGPLEQWMKDYIGDNLKALNIEVLNNASIADIRADRIQLQTGRVFEKAMLIWAAGVKTAPFIQNLNVEKNPQGRIKVDEFLRLNESCFVAGDTAYVQSGQSFLRMAVQFAVMQGRLTACNVLRSIRARPLLKYRPVDLGYIIPMANNKSCGVVLGVNLKGLTPTFFHYLMCAYRLTGLRNKLGIIKEL